MPIIDELSISTNTRAVVWEINESINDLKSRLVLSEDSLKLLNQKQSEIHKVQFLAVRHLIKYLSINPQNLKYDSLGKPFFENNYKISISHSGIYVAVIISDTAVGIDIETIDDRILKIKSKFLETELKYPIELNTSKPFFVLLFPFDKIRTFKAFN